MNQNIKIALIAFIAGILGAFTFQLLSKVASFDNTNIFIEEPGKMQLTKHKEPQVLSGSTDFVQAAALSTPSVVFIKTVSDAGFQELNLFDLYFGEGYRQRKVSGTGSGVIFTADGYIVTNNHVIEGAEKIEVIHQKKTYQARIIGRDPSCDLAIIKIEGKNLPAIKRGGSKDVQVGEWVIAVGNPFNLTSTVTAGIVSAKGRNIELLGGQFPLESFIQTDAAINPGNSGGALVNAKGELVGINTAILSRTGSYTGYGFAVPIDIVAKVFNDMLQYGEVQKGFTGLEVSDISTKIAETYSLKTDNFDGAVVVEVLKGSQAEQAGLKEGDVILKINGNAIAGKSNFDEILSYYRPGDKVTISYLRGNATKDVTLTLTNREGTTALLKTEVYNSEKLGVELENVSKVEKDKIGIQDGVRIVKVKRGFFSNLGIPEGFIVTAVNRQTVKTPQEFETLLTKAEGRVYIEGVTKTGQRGYYSFYF
jgi:Do/DeqQ family serine protease